MVFDMSGKLKHKKSEHPGFRRFLLVSVMRLAAPLIAVICTVSLVTLSVNFARQAIDDQAAALEETESDLASIIENVETLSRDLVFHDAVQTLLEASLAGEQYPQTADVAYYVNGFLANRDYIHSVILVGQNQTLYSNEKAVTEMTDFDKIMSSVWFSEFESGTDTLLWFVEPDYSAAEAFVLSGEEETDEIPELMMVRRVNSTDDYVTSLGWLILYLDDDYLTGILDTINYGSTTNLWLVDENGEVILKNTASADYSSLLAEIQSSESGAVIFTGGRRWIINKEMVSGSSWYLYSVTPYREINQSMRLVIIQTILMLCTAALIFLFFSFRSATTVSRPIVRLANIMDAYQRDTLTIRLPDKGSSSPPADPEPPEEVAGGSAPAEIAQIYHSFEEMTDRLENQIRENYIIDLEKKDAQIALLESQIDPHFLYNVLDSINWMAIANDEDEISEMITALSDMFRLSLNRSRNSFVALGYAVQYVESYLLLQQYRYQDCLHVSIDVDESLRSLPIPKFTLQPLVENAIKHGLTAPDEPFDIDITAASDGETLFITIGNDGDDISLSQMKKLLSFDPKKQEIIEFEKGSYGVQNIHRRIRFLCGAAYGLSYSVKDGRTFCEVRLPVQDPIDEQQQ